MVVLGVHRDLRLWLDTDGPRNPLSRPRRFTKAELGAPLAVLVARDGATLSGLRLLDGTLLAKVEWAGRAA